MGKGGTRGKGKGWGKGEGLRVGDKGQRLRMGKKGKGYGVGKKGRVKKGKRGHVLRVSGGENGRLWVGKRRKG